MRDFLELWSKAFRSKTKQGKRKPLPITTPAAPLTPKEVQRLKNKDRISELEKEVAELRERSSQQTQLLERLVRQLGNMNRDLAHLLPEE